MQLLPRRTFIYSVIRRRNVSRISIAAPSDFSGGWEPVASTLASRGLPYCLDFARFRAVYVTDVDPQTAAAASFYYLHLRRHAGRVLHVPLDHAFVSAGEACPDPVFLFSPGRCGSTLLSRILSEAGIASVSEPDFCTQVASWFWSRANNPLAPVFHRAMWTMTSDLTKALGGPPVIKLRAECSRAPHIFARHPSSAAIVLVRDFDSWAKSTAQAFGASPHKAVAKYLTALRCYDWLARHRRCLLTRYEDWLTDPAAAATKLGDFLGQNISGESVCRGLAAHSQAGTPLMGRQMPDWETKWEGARRLWRSPRLVSARKRLDLPEVWD